jgi:hypothetical protein
MRMTTALCLLPSLLFVAPAASDRAPVPLVVEARRTAAPLSETERDALRAAERTSTQDLRALRGGDITNSELTTIFLVLGIVVLLVILL